MTLEADIVEALRTSYATHQANLTEIAKLRAEAAGLKASVASLENDIAGLEAEAVFVVEPTAAQPVIDELMRAVKETLAALRPPEPSMPPAAMSEAAVVAAPPEMPTAPGPERPAPRTDDEEVEPMPRPRSSARGWDGDAAALEVPTTPPSVVAPREPSSRLSRFGFRLN